MRGKGHSISGCVLEYISIPEKNPIKMSKLKSSSDQFMGGQISSQASIVSKKASSKKEKIDKRKVSRGAEIFQILKISKPFSSELVGPLYSASNVIRI